MTSFVNAPLVGCCELDSMRHRNRGFGGIAGCARIKMDPKRLKLNPDIPLGRHNSLRYRTVGANAIIQLFEANRRNPGTPLTNIGNFGNTNHAFLVGCTGFAMLDSYIPVPNVPPGPYLPCMNPSYPMDCWNGLQRCPAWAWASCHGGRGRGPMDHTVT